MRRPEVYRIALFLVLSLAAFAADEILVRGEVVGAREFPMVGYSVELSAPANNFPDQRAAISAGGEFEILGLRPGNYQARVLKNNQVIYTTWITVRRDSGSVQIQLPQQEAPERPASGTISVRRLAHKPPKEAVKEAIRGAEARRKGDLEKSLRHLQKAVEIDPEYAEALNNLGARYVELQRFEEAAAAFERTIKIDPHCSQAYSNLGVVYLQTKRTEDAITAARRSLDIDGSAVRAHFVLAYALSLQDSKSEEALRHFMQAANGFPKALIGAAQILANRGENVKAREQLKAYMGTGDESGREIAKTIMTTLQP